MTTHLRQRIGIAIAMLLTAAGFCVNGSASSADDTLDWLMTQATTRPTTEPAQPSSQPVSPFGAKENPEARPGTIVLSDDRKISGSIATTREKPIRVYDDQAREYRDVPLKLIQSIRASVLWERLEPEWHFKESGSDLKEYTGKTYPARELQYTIKLINGQTFAGGIVAPLYVSKDDTQRLFVLNKRQKGEVGQALKELLYVRQVDFE